MTCWICGAQANSAEHKIKKSDLIRSYGRGPYSGANAPVHLIDQTQTNIRGPKALKLKYKPSLCTTCNNQRSQPWDLAYDQFIAWVLENEDLVLRRRLLDFADIFGPAFPELQLSLFKYFVKSLGCRFVDAAIQVPEDLVSLLPKEHFVTALKISFSVNEDLLLLPKASRDTWLAKGDMGAWNGEETLPKIGYSWHESVSWLTVKYWYGIAPDRNFGSPWIANSQFVYLGSYSPLDADQRVRFADRSQEQDS